MSFLQGLFSPPDVEKLKTKCDMVGLIKALSYPRDETIRKSAAVALGNLSDVRAVEPLIAALRDSDKAVRWAAAQALGKIGDARAVEPLIAALRDSDKAVRWEAAEVLGKIGDARAVEPLIAALQDRENDVRMAVVEALGKIGDARAVESLIATLMDSDQKVRLCAIKMLGNLSNARAVEPLITALQDNDHVVRKAAAEALDNIGWKPTANTVGATYWIANLEWDNCTKVGALAVEPLIVVLKDSDRNVRKAAADALGAIGDSRAVPPLCAALQDKDSYVYVAARKWLPNFGVLAVEPLLNDLKDRDEEVSERAAMVLGEIGDSRAVQPLIYEFENRFDEGQDQDWGGNQVMYRQNCAEALGKIGKPAVMPLIAALNNRNATVRWLAAETLGKIKDSRAMEPLKHALNDKDGYVRGKVAKALTQLSSAEIQRDWTEPEMLQVLCDLCDAYAANDQVAITRLVLEATAIGEALNERGGLNEMRRIFAKLGGRPGSRTLEMHWGGIGDWRG